MNPEWLCYVNGQEYGPYTWPQFVQMAQAGNLTPQTHVRRNFDSQWYLAEQVPGLFSAPAAPAPSAARATPKQAAHPATPARTTAASGISKSSSSLSKSGVQTAVAAPIHAPAAAPQVHVPVMQPEQPAVPKGRVVAAPTAVATAADTKPQWIPVNAQPSAAPSVALPTRTETPAPASKKDNSKQMVLYLGGAIAGVALLGCAALIWKFTRPPEQPKEVAAAPVVVPMEEADPNAISAESNGAEANPGDVVASTPAKSTTPASTPPKTTTNSGTKTATTPKSDPAKTAGAANASAALLKSVTAWKPIDKFGSIGTTSGLKCMKIECFLAADAAGRHVAWKAGAAPAAAPAPAADPAAAEATPAETPEQPAVVQYLPAEPTPFLFVTATITNGDKKIRVYEGWNAAKTAALLLDGQGNQLSLVPTAQTPGVLRQPTKELQPGETIQDTLVFAVPPNAELLFRLALPKNALAATFTGAWAYEISRTDLIAAQQTATAPGQAGDPPPQVRSSTTIPIPGLQDLPPPQPVQPAPPPMPAQPEMEKKPMPTERIPIPGLTDTPENKPAGPKKPDEVPNLNPPAKKK